MKKYIRIGIIAVALVIVGYILFTISNIKNKLEDIQYSTNNIQSELVYSIEDINNNIRNTLYEELGKTYITKDVKFTYEKSITDGYELTARVELSQIKDDSKVIFMYKDINTNEWIEVELEKINELSYAGKINIFNNKDYEYKVVTKGSLSESGDIETLDKYSFIPYPPEIGIGWSDEYININVYESFQEESSINNIKSMTAIVDVGGENKRYEFKYREEDTYDEEGNSNEYGKSIYYDAEIPKTYYGKNINIKITYKNGLIDVINITDKIIDEVN